MHNSERHKSPPGDHKDNMEVTINGQQGPTIKFRVGVLALINGIILTIGLGITFAILRADVELLKVESKQNAGQIHTVLDKLNSISTGLEYTRDEVRFLRDELAGRSMLRSTDNGSGGTDRDGKQ